MTSKLVMCAASALASCILTGCATPNSLRADGPVLEETTSLPARQVAGCIGDKLQAWPESSQQIPILATRLTETGYSISGSATLPGLWGAGGTDTVVLVDIDDLKTKTRVRLYTHFVMGGGVIVKMVRSCL